MDTKPFPSQDNATDDRPGGPPAGGFTPITNPWESPVIEPIEHEPDDEHQPAAVGEASHVWPERGASSQASVDNPWGGVQRPTRSAHGTAEAETPGQTRHDTEELDPWRDVPPLPDREPGPHDAFSDEPGPGDVEHHEPPAGDDAAGHVDTEAADIEQLDPWRDDPTRVTDSTVEDTEVAVEAVAAPEVTDTDVDGPVADVVDSLDAELVAEEPVADFDGEPVPYDEQLVAVFDGEPVAFDEQLVAVFDGEPVAYDEDPVAVFDGEPVAYDEQLVADFDDEPVAYDEQLVADFEWESVPYAEEPVAHDDGPVVSDRDDSSEQNESQPEATADSASEMDSRDETDWGRPNDTSVPAEHSLFEESHHHEIADTEDLPATEAVGEAAAEDAVPDEPETPPSTPPVADGAFAMTAPLEAVGHEDPGAFPPLPETAPVAAASATGQAEPPLVQRSVRDSVIEFDDTPAPVWSAMPDDDFELILPIERSSLLADSESRPERAAPEPTVETAGEADTEPVIDTPVEARTKGAVDTAIEIAGWRTLRALRRAEQRLRPLLENDVTDATAPLPNGSFVVLASTEMTGIVSGVDLSAGQGAAVEVGVAEPAKGGLRFPVSLLAKASPSGMRPAATEIGSVTITVEDGRLALSSDFDYTVDLAAIDTIETWLAILADEVNRRANERGKRLRSLTLDSLGSVRVLLDEA